MCYVVQKFYSYVVQRFKMGLTGLKSRCRQAAFFFERFRREGFLNKLL